MKYKITHTTTYDYSSAVSVCYNLIMLTPRESDRVASLSHRLVIRPVPALSKRRTDYFGNLVHAISLAESHKRLTITAASRVSVLPAQSGVEPGPAWEQVRDSIRTQADPAWLSIAPFVYDSIRVTRGPAFAEYALESFQPNRPIVDAVRELTARIHRDFAYDQTATAVSTPTAQAFDIRKGVCQDFTHVAVASLRSIGLAARYVSGYLRTHPAPGKPRLVGADQSHAWFSVYCGGALGWIEFDPTNDSLASTDHIPIAWGRDYDDVTPIRGVFLGGGEHTLTVAVDVLPVNGAENHTPVEEVDD